MRRRARTGAVLCVEFWHRVRVMGVTQVLPARRSGGCCGGGRGLAENVNCVT
jgi:hypothetical protein